MQNGRGNYTVYLILFICTLLGFLTVGLISAENPTKEHDCYCTDKSGAIVYKMLYKSSEKYEFLSQEYLKNNTISDIYKNIQSQYIILNKGMIDGDDQSVARISMFLLRDTNYIYILTICPHKLDKRIDIRKWIKNKDYEHNFIMSLNSSYTNCYLMVKISFKEYYDKIKELEIRDKSVKKLSKTRGTIFLDKFKKKLEKKD